MYILMKIKRPEGYEDVCDELVFEDAVKNMDPAFEPELLEVPDDLD